CPWQRRHEIRKARHRPELARCVECFRRAAPAGASPRPGSKRAGPLIVLLVWRDSLPTFVSRNRASEIVPVRCCPGLLDRAEPVSHPVENRAKEKHVLLGVALNRGENEPDAPSPTQVLEISLVVLPRLPRIRGAHALPSLQSETGHVVVDH